MNKRLITVVCVLALLVAAFGITAAAVDAENPASTVITLGESAGDLTFYKDTYLNLNGFDVESVYVEEGCTLYCMDSKTDNYVIEGDATNGYTGFGRIKSIAEDSKGKVTGVVAGTVPTSNIEEYPSEKLDSYLMVNEGEKGLSFHRVNLQIKSMSLRAQSTDETEYNPGVYYKSDFAGDALVAANVQYFGVALSVQESPDAGNMGLTNKYTMFEEFKAGENNANTSTLLKGIMKESNGKLSNRVNADMDIFGRAYIKTLDNQFVFGECVSRSLRKQVELTSQTEWGKLTETQQNSVIEMYRTYYALQKDWEVDNINDAYKAQEDKVLKVLTLGHSLALDATRMLNLIAEAEGYEEMVVGTLYYSGCPLWRHARNFVTQTPEHSLRLSSTKTPDQPPIAIDKVTVNFAVEYDYWDIVIMQGGVWEIAQDEKYRDGNIQTIQEWVKKLNRNQDAVFAWNMTWVPSTKDTWVTGEVDENGNAILEVGSDRKPTYSSGYETNYEEYFGSDRDLMYDNVVRCVKQYIATDDTFEFIIPSGVVLETAYDCGKLTPYDVYRDNVHATDLLRLMSGYAWYCKLAGVEQLEEVKLDVIPVAFFNSLKSTEDWVLTADEKDLIKEIVNTALATSFEATE